MRPAPGSDGDHVTFCRLCEAFCGLVATVERGRVVAVRPDRDNPHSRGHVCVKGMAIADVTYDPDRVTTPLKRVGGPGEFAPVSWDEALDDIAVRLAAIRRDHGGDAIASYLGNPTGYSSKAFGAFGGFMTALGSRKMYGAGSQDSNARLTAFYMIHGGPHYTTVPDLPGCDFLLVLGANPLVSNGWMAFNPRWRHDLDAIAARGAVVVVDPRATETARRYDHVSIRPDGDAWLLIGMLATLFAEGRIDRAAVAAIGMGLDALEAWVARVPAAAIAAHSGLSMDAIAALARRFADAGCAAAYGALGLCRGRYGTLGAYLCSVLNAVTGRYGAPGGVRFGHELLAQRGANRVGGHGERRTRIGGIPTIANKMATAMLPADIEEEGKGRVRAFVCSAGNPVLSAPGGAALERALAKLELHVSLDLYVTETNAHAHYILPSVTFLERADWPMIGMHVAIRPFVQYTPAVIPPVGDTREDYAIYEGLAARMGLLGPGEGRRLPPDPDVALDKGLRAGPHGDGFGERPGGWSRAKLLDHPHGVMLDAADDAADWPRRIGYADGKLRLWHELADVEMARLLAEPLPANDALRLVGRRDIRSINSWMHNVDRLVRGQAPRLLIHPDDAGAHGIADGDRVRVTSAAGRLEAVAELSEEVRAGSLSYPHGWGHAGGWRRANDTAAANVNALHGTGEEFVERVSGMSLIDCLDVMVERIDQTVQ